MDICGRISAIGPVDVLMEGEMVGCLDVKVGWIRKEDAWEGMGGVSEGLEV